jgi:endonuclease YncB( thermonuclease family)
MMIYKNKQVTQDTHMASAGATSPEPEKQSCRAASLLYILLAIIIAVAAMSSCLAVQTDTNSNSDSDSNRISIGDIEEKMIGDQITIRGYISDIMRYESGHAKALITDTSGQITVYIHSSSEIDLLMLLTDHEYLVRGIVDTYKGELQILPQNSADVSLISAPVFEKVEVTEVVDGDTIHVVDSNGERQTIRFIGVDTPELPKENKTGEDYALEAQAFANMLLANKTVFLERDHDDTDQYGRKLRYVWLKQPDIINEDTIREDLVSARLIEEGYAEFVHYNEDRKYKELLTKLESEAQENNIGMWQNN